MAAALLGHEGRQDAGQHGDVLRGLLLRLRGRHQPECKPQADSGAQAGKETGIHDWSLSPGGKFRRGLARRLPR